MASMNGLKMLFPNIVQKGCYFHWCKNINKKADKLGHSKVYAEKRVIGLTKALALMPSQRIMEGWQFIKELCVTLEMPKFIKYVENFWLKKHSLDVISVFGERHRTNDVLEGYHSKLRKNINTSNKTLLRLLNKIMPYQGSGSIISQRKKKQITNDNMIMKIQIGLATGSLSVGQALEQLKHRFSETHKKSFSLLHPKIIKGLSKEEFLRAAKDIENLYGDLLPNFISEITTWFEMWKYPQPAANDISEVDRYEKHLIDYIDEAKDFFPSVAERSRLALVYPSQHAQ